mmetsp:Transcript_13193/g.34549  ORF Transcript_13193/g.34549 Transcript_13193/m.34549 type:complete len:609 (-) Transcript_13193:3385-5211(-)
MERQKRVDGLDVLPGIQFLRDGQLLVGDLALLEPPQTVFHQTQGTAHAPGRLLRRLFLQQIVNAVLAHDPNDLLEKIGHEQDRVSSHDFDAPDLQFEQLGVDRLLPLDAFENLGDNQPHVFLLAHHPTVDHVLELELDGSRKSVVVFLGKHGGRSLGPVGFVLFVQGRISPPELAAQVAHEGGTQVALFLQILRRVKENGIGISVGALDVLRAGQPLPPVEHEAPARGDHPRRHATGEGPDRNAVQRHPQEPVERVHEHLDGLLGVVVEFDDVQHGLRGRFVPMQILVHLFLQVLFFFIVGLSVGLELFLEDRKHPSVPLVSVSLRVERGAHRVHLVGREEDVKREGAHLSFPEKLAVGVGHLGHHADHGPEGEARHIVSQNLRGGDQQGTEIAGTPRGLLAFLEVKQNGFDVALVALCDGFVPRRRLAQAERFPQAVAENQQPLFAPQAGVVLSHPAHDGNHVGVLLGLFQGDIVHLQKRLNLGNCLPGVHELLLDRHADHHESVILRGTVHLFQLVHDRGGADVVGHHHRRVQARKVLHEETDAPLLGFDDPGTGKEFFLFRRPERAPHLAEQTANHRFLLGQTVLAQGRIVSPPHQGVQAVPCSL